MCICPFNKQWKLEYPCTTLGEGKINDFIYNEKALKLCKIEVINLINQLLLPKEPKKNLASQDQKKVNLKFQDMKKLKNGQHWTELNFYVEILFSLANAINLMEFEYEKKDWNKEEKENPTIKVNMKTR